MANGNETIEELLGLLKEARERLDEATQEEGKARNRRTDALNVFNGITHRLDAAYKKLRESAPRETDWQHHAGEPA